ncbi:MAG TPA: peptidoglycan editing factor PgeF [Caldithrix abyssi]|uniref:Purine nucleoside phosphorylase n=1 Tax=Caldithrix abyssi TaxID=187145 RepID=A0A7V4U061_CALAY|nr:peptidoglycan editing factor PgeF [Caldithrix abyssi]
MQIKQFDIFGPFSSLLHAFSTRIGGVSRPPFHELNLGLHTADNRKNVEQNRRLFFDRLKISEQQVVFPEQVHSDHIEVVSCGGVIPRCDGLITVQKNVFLSVQTADCFPVFIFDPKQEVVALVHSGWRGTARNICGKAVGMMKDQFGSRAEDLLAAIGPGVQQTCYQVDEETAACFQDKYLIPDGIGHYKLDVQGCIVGQLKEAGIPIAQMEIDRACTHCADHKYYSYRRDGQNSGRMMGIIGISEML